MEELANPDEHRVLYAIEILESLEKRNLVTPLLLFHDSRAVRVRVLQALRYVKPEIAERWLPSIQRMIATRVLRCGPPPSRHLRTYGMRR